MSGFDAAGMDAAGILPDTQVSPQPVGLLRWATAGYRSAPEDEPANTRWEPRLLGDVVLQQAATDAFSLGGMLGVGIGEIELADADAALADLDRYGTADGRRISITRIPVVDPTRSDYGTPLSGRGLGMTTDLRTGVVLTRRTDPLEVFRGLVQRVDRTGERTGVLRISDWMEQLSVPLQPVKFLGTGGLEGDDSHKGKPKPFCLGRNGNITPVDMGNVDLGVGIGPLRTYLANWREIRDVTAVRIRGVPQTLVTGNPVLGQARIFPDLGALQLGGTPEGAVTADVRGDAAGGYVSSLAGMTRRLVTGMGPQLGTDDIDDVSFAFAETDLPGEMGRYQGAEDITCAAFADDLVRSCGALLVARRGGKLGLVDLLATGIDQFSLQPWMILDCQPVPLPLAQRPLPREVAVNWRRNWTVLSDLAGAVTSADRTWLTSAHSGPARAASAKITKRVAQQRTWTLDGYYWNEVDAQARAQKYRAFFEHGPRMFEVITDHYLGQIETGHIGRITYPQHELDLGVRISVVGWKESLAEQRLTLTVLTQPET